MAIKKTTEREKKSTKKTGLGADAFWGTPAVESPAPADASGGREATEPPANGDPVEEQSDNLGSQEENNPGTQKYRNPDSQEDGSPGIQIPRNTGSREDRNKGSGEPGNLEELLDELEVGEASEDLGTQVPRNIDRFNKYTFPLSDSLRERMDLAVRKVGYVHNIDLPKALLLRMGLEMVLAEIEENLESMLSGLAYLQEREMEVAIKYASVKGLEAYRNTGIGEPGNTGT